MSALIKLKVGKISVANLLNSTQY